jgi:two-component system, NarL family, sensor histidine kinase UhpB
MPDVPPNHILIVDDDAGLLRLIERRLKREGFATATASSGRDAIAWLTTNRADLLLLDLKLPDLGGRDLIDHLESIDRAVPFVIITGQGDERVAVEMMKRGALDYLVKDVQFMEFVPAVVRRALDRLASDRKLTAAEQALRERVEELSAILDSVPTPVFIAHDRDCQRLTGNRAANELLRIPHEVDVSKPRPLHFKAVKEGRELSPEELPAQRAARGVSVQNFEFTLAFDDGSTRDVLGYGTPLRDLNGEPRGAVHVLIDITERKRLEREILAISEREQRKFGHDLHDVMGQRLTALEMLSNVLAEELEEHDSTLAKQARRLNQELRETVTHARLISHSLAPVPMAGEGLMQGLHELATSINRLPGVKCQFRCDKPVRIQDVVVATNLYRIAQEAVNNALKHGKAAKIEIALTEKNDSVELSIKNNGAPIPAAPRQDSGMGLNVMRYRADMIGARLAIESGARKGVRVVCTLRRPA